MKYVKVKTETLFFLKRHTLTLLLEEEIKKEKELRSS